jgi:hypothetical protein
MEPQSLKEDRIAALRRFCLLVDALVVRFRHLHPFATHSWANVGIKRTTSIYDSRGAFEFDI